MKNVVVLSLAVVVVACSPKASTTDPKTPELGSGADTASVEAEAVPASTGEAAASSASGCRGPSDCKGGYCQRGIMGDAACTNEPNIMNAVILCKETADCKDLCVAFKGNAQCGKAEGTCNCEGK